MRKTQILYKNFPTISKRLFKTIVKNELGKTEEVFYSMLTSAHCVYKNKFMLKLIKRHIGFIITILLT